MCAIYTLKAPLTDLAHELNADLTSSEGLALGRYLPYSKAPVVIRKENRNLFRPMNFSLVPSWSKTPKVKFATHNARLDTILEKPTWRGPFAKNHCLVPISEFVESITEIGKEWAGHMVRFRDKKNTTLVAAGIFDEWINKETGEVLESFAILTDDPPAYVADIGHDRCPVFLQPQPAQDWLAYTGDSRGGLELLRQGRQTIDFAVEMDRALKPGWEKR